MLPAASLSIPLGKNYLYLTLGAAIGFPIDVLQPILEVVFLVRKIIRRGQHQISLSFSIIHIHQILINAQSKRDR